MSARNTAAARRLEHDHYPQRPAASTDLGPLFDAGYRADPPSIAKESSERGAEMAPMAGR
jgi:hypothetical protein